MLILVFAAIAVVAYLLGSIPCGYLAGLSKGVDLRKAGSGNIGATNALRVLGKPLGYATFAGDFLKGFLAVKLGSGLAHAFLHGYAVEGGIAAALFAVVGHMFPVWLGFRGGKGIATSGGIMLGLFPWPVFTLGLILWIILFFTTRYVSIASIAAAISLPTTTIILYFFNFPGSHWLLCLIALIMAALAVWRHKPNIERLLNGTEKRFEGKGRNRKPAES